MTASLATLRRALLQDEVDVLPGWTPGVGHLDQCQSADMQQTCPTCAMHALTPAVTHLLAMRRDIDALVDAPTSLAAVVAVAELRRSFDHLATDGHEAVGVRAARERLTDLTRTRLRGLLDVVESSLTAGGSLADDLEPTACLLAVPRLLADASGEDLSVRVLDELEALDRLTEAGRVASVLVGYVDRSVRQGLPPLTTQPEWQKLPTTPLPSEPTPRDTLEALVAESIADEVLERATSIADSLTSIPGHRVIRRPSPATAMPSTTRSLVWRRATINWPLSVADTGLAKCWRPAFSPDRLRLAVPLLAAAGLSAKLNGAATTSALHPVRALSV